MRKSLCAIASLRLCEAFLQSPPISFSHYDHDRKERFGQYGTKPLFFSMTSSSSPVNGETFNIEGTVSDDGLVSSAPISYDKYVLMQSKRVVVTVRYSEGMKPFYLTVAKRVKESHPDVFIEKRILPAPSADMNESSTFEVFVDGKIQVGKGRKNQAGNVQDGTGGANVFVSMFELDQAVDKARKKRRPTTVYVYGGEDEEDGKPGK